MMLPVDIGITLSDVVKWMVVLAMVFLTILSSLMVRQVSLMGKILSVPIHGAFRMIAWGYLLLVVVMTAIVVLI